MPFDPRIIPVDQPPLCDDGGLDLPDELAELAEQLADDAVFLSQRYPAHLYSQGPVETQQLTPASAIAADGPDADVDPTPVSESAAESTSKSRSRRLRRSLPIWLSASLACVCLAFVMGEIWQGESSDRVASSAVAKSAASSVGGAIAPLVDAHDVVTVSQPDNGALLANPSDANRTETVATPGLEITLVGATADDFPAVDAGGLSLENMSTLELEAVVDLGAPEGGISF